MRDDITNSEIEEYLASLMPPRPSPLNDMERIGRESGWPLVGAVEGQFLYMLARTSGVQHALEIGTATGYAAIWLLRALVQNPEGRLTAIEKDPLRYTRAREWVAKAGYSDRFSIHEGDWFEELANMRGPFDLIFLDILRHLNNEKEALQALEMCVPFSDEAVFWWQTMCSAMPWCSKTNARLPPSSAASKNSIGQLCTTSISSPSSCPYAMASRCVGAAASTTGKQGSPRAHMSMCMHVGLSIAYLRGRWGQQIGQFDRMRF